VRFIKEEGGFVYTQIYATCFQATFWILRLPRKAVFSRHAGECRYPVKAASAADKFFVLATASKDWIPAFAGMTILLMREE